MLTGETAPKWIICLCDNCSENRRCKKLTVCFSFRFCFYVPSCFERLCPHTGNNLLTHFVRTLIVYVARRQERKKFFKHSNLRRQCFGGAFTKCNIFGIVIYRNHFSVMSIKSRKRSDSCRAQRRKEQGENGEKIQSQLIKCTNGWQNGLVHANLERNQFQNAFPVRLNTNSLAKHSAEHVFFSARVFNSSILKLRFSIPFFAPIAHHQ